MLHYKFIITTLKVQNDLKPLPLHVFFKAATLKELIKTGPLSPCCGCLRMRIANLDNSSKLK